MKLTYLYKGHEYTLAGLAKIAGIKPCCMYNRLLKFRTVEEAVERKKRSRTKTTILEQMKKLASETGVSLTTIWNRYYHSGVPLHLCATKRSSLSQKLREISEKSGINYNTVRYRYYIRKLSLAECGCKGGRK